MMPDPALSAGPVLGPPGGGGGLYPGIGGPGAPPQGPPIGGGGYIPPPPNP